MCVFTRCDNKSIVSATANFYSVKRQTFKNVTVCPLPLYSTDLALSLVTVHQPQNDHERLIF